MLKIKLARFGKRKQAHYRIVVNEARDKRDGAYVESLGHYGPTQQPKLLELDLDRYQYWLEHGAQPTDTVAFLAKMAKNGGKFPKKKQKPSKKKQAKKNKTDK
jgi:small subunit ribosomal protein S16